MSGHALHHHVPLQLSSGQISGLQPTDPAAQERELLCRVIELVL